MSRTRLLWLIDSLHVGGAEALVMSFVRSYDRERYELYVAALSRRGENRMEQELRAAGVNTINFGARNLRDFRAFRRLLHFVREQRIELVHAHLTYSALWAAAMSRLTKVPSVVSLHVAPSATQAVETGFVRRQLIVLKDRLMRFVVARWASRVVMVSAGLRDIYLASGGLPPAKIRVVHNGIDATRFQQDREQTRRRLEHDLDIPAGAPIAVTVSVLRPAKGIEVLLEAVPQLPGVFFVIVGDGPMKTGWVELARAAGVADRVRWAGYRSDVENVLAGCDVFVHPSLDDAFPTVLLEAMAAGLPVVASRVGGIPEIVEHGVTGILVPPGDAAALTHAVGATLADPERRSHMGAEARRRSDLFSTAAWQERLTAVYDEVLA